MNLPLLTSYSERICRKLSFNYRTRLGSLSLLTILVLAIIIVPVNVSSATAAVSDKGGQLNIHAAKGLGELAATIDNSKSGTVKLIGSVSIQNLPATSNIGQTPKGLPEMPEPANLNSPQSSMHLEPKTTGIVIKSAPASAKVANVYSGFEGSSVNGWYPSDGGLAVSNNYIFEVTNIEAKIWDKQGNVLSTFSLDTFFSTSDFVADPRVLYDSQSGRWFVSVLAYDNINNGKVLFAVSKTSNPTGAYWQYAITFSALIPDQPRIAISGDKFAIVADDFDYTTGWVWTGSESFFFNKAEVKSGAITAYRTYLDSVRFHLEPAQRVGAGNDIWFVTAGYDNSISAEYLKASGNPKLASFSFSSVYISPIATTHTPPVGVQPDTTIEVETGDARLTSASINGTILTWVANDGCNPPFDSVVHSCIRWDVFDISSGLLLQDISFGQSGKDLFYAAVSQNSPKSFGIMFGFSSETDYPSVGVAGQSECDPYGTVDNPKVSRAGTAPNTSGRMGDYHGIQYDQTTSNFYGMSDYNRAGYLWNTWIGIFSVSCSVTHHSTTLSLNSIPDMPWNKTFTVSGRLTDNNASGIGIPSKTIEFTSSGVAISATTTDANGFYSATATAPSTAGTVVNIQAHFSAVGEVFYNASDSPTRSFTTLKHVTNLTVKAVNVAWGMPTKFNSILTDQTLGGVVLASKTIHWSGTGVIGVGDQVTDSSGFATGTGTAPNTVGTGWTVQAQFAGDSQYAAKNSAVKTYDTAKHKVTLSLTVSPTSILSTGKFTVKGILLDSTSGGTALTAQTVSFSTTAPLSIPSTVTSDTGQYSLTGLLAPPVGSYNIQAQFAGNSLYEAKSSVTRTLAVT